MTESNAIEPIEKLFEKLKVDAVLADYPARVLQAMNGHKQ